MDEPLKTAATGISVRDLQIRIAREEDLDLVIEFIRELAEYEKLLHEVQLNRTSLRECLFGPKPYAEILIAQVGFEPAGFALFFHNFSTFVGRPGLYLEDFYIRPAFRGRGIGRALLVHLARLANKRDCGRMEWSVLDWNTRAIEFYERLGAVAMNNWTLFRLTGEALRKFGKDSFD